MPHPNLDPNSMITTISLYTLFYATFCIFFIFPTREFVSLGITVEGLFEWFLKSESENFIFYQMRRTCMTLLVHSILPLGYILFLLVLSDKGLELLFVNNIWMSTFLIFSFIFPILTSVLILYWNKNGTWNNHPIAKTLELFCDPNTSWRQLSSDINTEFRNVDKVALQTSTIHRIIATDNWIMKVSPYQLDIAHQSDSALVLCQADMHQVSVDGQGVVQYVNIEVKTTRRGVKSFFIRCNATDFHLLQHKVDRPISVLQGIVFYKTLTEQFLEVFEETVKNNPPYLLPKDEQLDQCIGCMVTEPSVKLVKCCSDPEPCSKCYCRPLWCLSCMGRWFASRQEQDRPETWLGSTCTCPLCRSVFCILDVCPIERTSQ